MLAALTSALLLLAPLQPASVLMVVLDDVGLWDLGAHTPNINALAARSLSFTRAYGFPVCSPSRYAALFGEWPRRAGIGHLIDAHVPAAGSSPAPPWTALSLAEVLKPSFATFLAGKWHLGRAACVDLVHSGPPVQGFDRFVAMQPNSVNNGVPLAGYYNYYLPLDPLEQNPLDPERFPVAAARLRATLSSLPPRL